MHQLRLFQSAPRPRDRGDSPKSKSRGHKRSGFNPRPGHVTGATPVCGQLGLSRFNPRPGHVTGATLVEWNGTGRARFNPRPGHVTGATMLPLVSCAIQAVSIRAPAT